MPARRSSSSAKQSQRFSTQSRFVLPGSEKSSFAQPAETSPAPPAKRITVSVILKGKTPVGATNRLTRVQFRQMHGPDS